jgi:hypothetical protein
MKHTTGTSGNRFLRWQGDTWWAILSNHLGLGTCKVKQGDTLCHRITRGLAQPSRQLIYHSVPDSSSRTASDAAPPQPPLSLCTSRSRCAACKCSLPFLILFVPSCWPAHLPFFLSFPSLHPSLLLTFFCRGDQDTQKVRIAVSHCLGDTLKTMVELTFTWLSGLLCSAHYVCCSNHHNTFACTGDICDT